MIQKPSGPTFMWVIYLNRFSSNLEDKTKQLVRTNLQGLSSPATHMLLCNKDPIGVNKPFPSTKTHTHTGEIPLYPNTLALLQTHHCLIYSMSCYIRSVFIFFLSNFKMATLSPVNSSCSLCVCCKGEK